VQSGFGLLGAHWGLADVEAFFEKYAPETAGDQATAMGHGIVAIEPGRGPVFFATEPSA
jgi:hypothetical protein